MEGSIEPFFKRIRFSDFSQQQQQQQQHCHFNQKCDDDDAACFVSFPDGYLRVALHSSMFEGLYTILSPVIFMSHQWSSG